VNTLNYFRAATTLTGAMMSFVLLSGCAGQAAVSAEADAARGDQEAASQLYDGQPAVVHATEYPVASADEGIARGDAAWRAGKLDLAVYLYVQSLAYDATAAEPFLKIGAIHERQGNEALAERAFEFALERDPDNAGANERLGLLYLRSGRNDEARARLERAIAIDSDRWQSHNGLGIVADRSDDFTSAIAHYDTALVLAPGTASVINNRGYSRYLDDDLAGAEADFRQAIALGAAPGTWTNLGKVLARQARYADALESLLKEMHVSAAYNLIGEIAMEAGDLVAAQEQFTEAIRASPRHYQAARDNLALAEARIGEAIRHPTRITQSDASVYAKGAVIGKVERGERVAVLHTQGRYSLVRYQGPQGPDLTGWVMSASLGETTGTP